MHNTLGKKELCPAQVLGELRRYDTTMAASHAKEAAADSARTRVQPMMFGDDYKPNTAREVEERAEKAKDLNYTFAIGQHLLILT